MGGGPAGSSAAITLAEQGHPVTVLERDSFPRFHIGESLLPAGNRALARLGVLDSMTTQGFTVKEGAEFTVPDRSAEVINEFAEGIEPGLDSAFQVERSRFDLLLLDRAREVGASVHESARVTRLEQVAEGWTVTFEQKGVPQTIQARFLIDASGRSRLLGKHLGLPMQNLPYPKKVAVFAHYSGFPRRSGSRRGNIEITRIANGWIWVIPLADERTSVGWVTELENWKAGNGTPEERLEEILQSTPWISSRMAGASRCSPVRMEQDYTYSFKKFAGRNYFLAGDAACFIDPIFSSGVALALDSGMDAAGRILRCPKGSTSISSREQHAYTSRFRSGTRMMRRLIDLFYDDDGFAVLMNPTNNLRLAPAVNSVVAGDVRPKWSIRWRFALVLLIFRANRHLHFLSIPSEKTRISSSAATTIL